MTDFDAVKQAVTDKDVIIHAAAQVAVTTSLADPPLTRKQILMVR